MSSTSTFTLADAQAEIAAALQPLTVLVEGLQVYGYMNTNPTPPSLDVFPGDPFQTGAGFGVGESQLFFTIRGRVSTADQTCARQERDLRAFAKKAGYKVVGVWKETASWAKQERAELTPWGRSMLDLFPHAADLQTWGVSLVAQTGWQFDLRSAQGKLIASLMAALAGLRSLHSGPS